MSGVGLLMTLVAALGWAALDASRKVLVGGIPSRVLLVVLTLGQCPAFALSMGLYGEGIHSWLEYAPRLALGVAVNVATNLLYLRALRRSPLSVVIPLLALVPVFTVLIAAVFLGEQPGLLQWVGVLIVGAGALLLNASASSSRRLVDLVGALARERGAMDMALAALMASAGIVLDKSATAHASLSAHGFMLNLGIGVTVLIMLHRGQQLHQFAALRGRMGLTLVAILIASTAMATQLIAIQHVLTGIVEAIKRSVGMLVSVAAGRFMFREPVPASKLAAVALMIAGTVLLVV